MLCSPCYVCGTIIDRRGIILVRHSGRLNSDLAYFTATAQSFQDEIQTDSNGSSGCRQGSTELAGKPQFRPVDRCSLAAPHFHGALPN
jgi:hypothetical protein